MAVYNHTLNWGSKHGLLVLMLLWNGVWIQTVCWMRRYKCLVARSLSVFLFPSIYCCLCVQWVSNSSRLCIYVREYTGGWRADCHRFAFSVYKSARHEHSSNHFNIKACNEKTRQQLVNWASQEPIWAVFNVCSANPN